MLDRIYYHMDAIPWSVFENKVQPVMPGFHMIANTISELCDSSIFCSLQEDWSEFMVDLRSFCAISVRSCLGIAIVFSFG